MANEITLEEVKASEYLTIEESEKYINMSREVIRNYLHLGRFTKYKFKNNVLLSKKELNAHLNK